MTDLVVARKEGLFCVPGRFYIDPWRPVERAVITHAHADHARPGHVHYLAATSGAAILKSRLGDITLVLFCYSLGKAQRILNGIDNTIGPIICHGAIDALNRVYREGGIPLPDTLSVSDIKDKAGLRGALVMAPPSAAGSPWMRRFGDYSDAFASGWMLLRGARRRRAVDRGFVLSDHADWPGLMAAITATGAQRVIVTHGHVDIMVRWLRENGFDASAFDTEYGTEEDDNVAANESIAFKESHA